MYRIIILASLLCLFIFGNAISDEVEITTQSGKMTIRIISPDKEISKRLASPEGVLAMIKEDIRKLRNDYIQKIDSTDTRRKAMATIDELEDLCMLLNSFITVRPMPAMITPMGESAFMKLLSQLKEEPFTENRLKLLDLTAKDNYFTVDQIGSVMDVFGMEEDKVKAVEILYPKVVDKINRANLLSKVQFTISKNKLKAIIEK